MWKQNGEASGERGIEVLRGRRGSTKLKAGGCMNYTSQLSACSAEVWVGIGGEGRTVSTSTTDWQLEDHAKIRVGNAVFVEKFAEQN